MIQHERSAEHYARIERERLRTEGFLAALVRVAVQDAVAAVGSQTAAGLLLGESQQTVSRVLSGSHEAKSRGHKRAADRWITSHPLTLVNQGEL